METRLGRIPAECERPEPLKFAWPLMLLPELFTTARHLAVARGYFASIGWEVYAPDLRTVAKAARTDMRASDLSDGASRASSAGGFDGLAALLAEALAALARDAIVIGHGLGGLLALSAVEQPQVRAAVALAPMLPGFRSALVTSATNWPARLFGRALKPPRGAVLFDLLADAEPFQREALMRALVADDARAALEVVRGGIKVGGMDLANNPRAVPRLIVAGDSDPFAPLDRTNEFAARVGAAVRVVRGRGHWLIGGRALERTVAEVQRFLVRNLGGDLLLLYPEEWK
ncbi:MAG TPA: alpha/beta fold hydrolase [Candidatus Binataceae bacterium]|jgi:pimeloyl-ACP methyl ester carboxylesterase|nr:alpha/beta fold hydrolase [Candidatus Binataceae bacterium]